MINKTLFSFFISASVVLTSTFAEDNSSFRFLATGDVPYSPEQNISYGQLLQQSEQEDFAFLMHVGDIKAQFSPCTDDRFRQISDLFEKYPKPVVYTPGDNEWTDCHGVGADPIERLAKIRELFFQHKPVLRLDELNAVHQSDHPETAEYIENYRFTKAGVLFIVAHVCGSGNNRRIDDPPSMREYKARNQANLAFLKESFAIALQNRVPGVALVIHANPDFENGKGEGFRDILATLRDFLAEYQQPVVCIHGDSHYFRIDKPFHDEAGTQYLHFTRMEVFGAPTVAGVIVNVDPTDPQVFSYRPYYMDNN
jgi:hypothetical protein